MCSNQLLDQSSQLESSSCGQLFKATYFVKTILSFNSAVYQDIRLVFGRTTNQNVCLILITRPFSLCNCLVGSVE